MWADQSADYIHIFSYGQSLSRGSIGIPARPTTQPYNNKTFLSGVLIQPGDNADLRTDKVYDASAFKPLIEKRLGDHPSAEIPVSSTLNGLCDLIKADVAQSVNKWSFVGSAPGRGGVSIKLLGPGTGYWQGLISQIHDAMSIAEAEGKSYAVWAMTWAQGENDPSISLNDYQTTLLALKDDFIDQTRNITGQSLVPLLVSYQTAAHKRYKRNFNNPAISQWRQALNDPDIVMATPIYHLPHANDKLHLTNDSYVQLGKYFARALYQTIFTENPWEPLWPKSINWYTDAVEIVFNVPTGTLKWDSKLVQRAPNYGFDLWRTC